MLRCDDNRNFVCLRPKFSLCQKKEKCLLLPLIRSMPMIQWSFECLIQVMCRTDCWNGLIFYPTDDPKHDTNVFFGTSLFDSEFPQSLVLESPRWGLDAQVHTSSDGWLRKKPGLSRELFVDTIRDVGNRSGRSTRAGHWYIENTLLGTNIYIYTYVLPRHF